MHHLVAEKSDKEGSGGDNDDASISRDFGVDGIDKLCADDDINRRPSNAGEDVEARNYAPGQWSEKMKRQRQISHTNLHTVEAKEEPGQDHLPQAKFWPKGREEADRQYAEQVEK